MPLTTPGSPDQLATLLGVLLVILLACLVAAGLLLAHARRLWRDVQHAPWLEGDSVMGLHGGRSGPVPTPNSSGGHVGERE